MNAEPANWAPHTAHALELVREISPAAGQRISLHVWSTATRHATLDADHDDVARRSEAVRQIKCELFEPI